MRGDPIGRVLLPTAGGLTLFGILAGGGVLYTFSTSAAADTLVSQMLVNAIMVLGLQIFIGNTGILSFGHMGFAAIAGYVVAVLAIDPRFKQVTIPEAPLGLADISMGRFSATFVAVGIVLLVALFVGLGLTRSASRAGAIAPTMITLALLFLVREAANNFTSLTAGNRAGLSFGPGNSLQGRVWIYVALLLSILAARLFRETRIGRLAQAAREDGLAARSMGINPAVPQMMALLLSVVLITVGASLRVQLLGSMTPNFFFFSFTLLTLAMLIVGGRNSVAGALLGVAIITAGNELTRFLAGSQVTVPGFGWLLREGLSNIFLGGAMLGFMILRPEGLLGDWELDDWARRRLHARERAPEPIARLAGRRRPAVLSASAVTVDFGGFRALRDTSIEVRAGEVVGLIGPNGAGKTTLLNAITGLVGMTSGTVLLGDRRLSGRPTHRIARVGVARTFQNFRLFPGLSVRENVAVAALVAARHRRQRYLPDVDGLLVSAGLWELQLRRAGELDFGSARKLELARAAAMSPDFLLLDEPTAGMSEAESTAMVEHVRQTATLVGAGVVVVDHDLRFITSICDRIYVLDQGTVIAHGTPVEIQADPHVQAAYLGTGTAAGN